MKQESDKDKELDDLFRSGLADPLREPAFREEDWDAMEAMLDQRKKRSAIVYWLPVAATVAAVALLFLAWALLSPGIVKTDKADHNMAAAGKKHSADTGTQSAAAQLANRNNNDSLHQLAAVPAQPEQNNLTPAGVKQKPSALTAGTNTGKQKPISSAQHFNTTGKLNSTSEQPGLRQDGEQIANLATQQKTDARTDVQQPVKDDQSKNPANDNNIAGNSSAGVSNTVATADVPKKSVTDDVIKQPKIKPVGKALGYKPQMAITALASSDFNGVGSSFAQTRVGGNFGMLFSVGISRKITVSTGAIYAIKPYAETSSQYHTAYQFKQPLQQITADCRMLDIPINVDYQVYHANRNKFSIGTGLSSYLMMSEKYNYVYAGSDSYTPGPGMPASYKVPHPGKYYLGVLNLEATYQHQINSRFGVAVQPYMKVPLGNVGFSQVKLQSTGLAIGVSYNISSGGQ